MLGLGCMGMSQSYGTPEERDERELATRKGVMPGQVALAWLLHKGPDIVPIPGTKRRRYLEKNVGAAGVSLGAEEMSELDAALAPEKVAGPRYSAKQMAQVDR